MTGRRLPDGMHYLDGAPGDYWHDPGEGWACICPNGDGGNLSSHTVVEHADRTITVAPSILITGGGNEYHGFLERGVWRHV